MILRVLTLANIRSYESHRIEFPTGSVLLAGDIGAGKSTILLAIEFALFGIKAGELSGNSLLRRGCAGGSVTLTFSLQDQEITIERSLKRTKQGVTQLPGSITRNGQTTRFTPTELRSQIFELMGYPKDIITKSKDLIFRYTIYTPQESLKDILFDHPDERLDTLRRVFVIDKYKRMRDNALLLLGSLKDKRKHIEGYISDVESKKQRLEQLSTSKEELAAKLQPLQDQKVQKQTELDTAFSFLQQSEESIKELRSHKETLIKVESTLSSTIAQFTQTTKERARIDQELDQKPIDVPPDVQPIIIQATTELRSKETELIEHKQATAAMDTKLANLSTSLNSVTTLDSCPVCKQQVGSNHKHTLTEQFNHEQQALQEQKAPHLAQVTKLEMTIEQMRKNIEQLQHQSKQHELTKLKKQQQEQLLTRKQVYDQSLVTLKKEVGTLNAQKAQLSAQLTGYDEKERQCTQLRMTWQQVQQQQQTIEVQYAQVAKEIEGIERQVFELSKELDQKQQSKQELGRINEHIHWISSFFMNLMHTMEKHVMIQINAEFNEFFKQWFGIIMEDESLSVRITDEFTPLVEQNGYDAALYDLSGGEKTSVALAYRLALHKVINDVVSEIKTKDLLILDEPTDGFSTEQLDNVRQVLDALSVNQLLVVSHEPKIESYVDHVLRVRKRDTVSEVVV